MINSLVLREANWKKRRKIRTAKYTPYNYSMMLIIIIRDFCFINGLVTEHIHAYICKCNGVYIFTRIIAAYDIFDINASMLEIQTLRWSASHPRAIRITFHPFILPCRCYHSKLCGEYYIIAHHMWYETRHECHGACVT